MAGQTKVSRKVIGQLAELVFEGGAQKASKILGDKLTVVLARHGKWRKNDGRKTAILTIGRPNFRNRKAIAKAKKEGRALPLGFQILYPRNTKKQ